MTPGLSDEAVERPPQVPTTVTHSVTMVHVPDSLTLFRACRKPPLLKGDPLLYTLTSLNPQTLALVSSHSREPHFRPSSLLWYFLSIKTLCFWHFSTLHQTAKCRISTFEKMALKLSITSVKVLYTNTGDTLPRKQGTHSPLPPPGPRGTGVPASLHPCPFR